MTPELTAKITLLNETLRLYQRGLYSEAEFKRALSAQYEKNWPNIKELQIAAYHIAMQESNEL